MLRFTKLVVEDIGPFKGSQTIDFTNENGVTFIWGNNGRGKTTLLNIFRYALFGRFKNRHGASVDYTILTNSESRSEGKYGFKVILYMTYDNESYELTRQYSVRSGISHPSRNDDYESHMFLKKGTSILSKPDAEHILKSIMPEQVSRFFLFDGELLQEYEELLIDDAEAGKKIKTSIEEILGVPVLTNSAIDTESALQDCQKQKNKAAQRDQQTQQIASQIDMLTAQLTEHNDNLLRLQASLTEERARNNRLEGEMQDDERAKKLLNDIQNAEDSISEKKNTRENLLSSIIVETKSAWRWMVGDRVSKLLRDIQTQLVALENKQHDYELAKHFIEKMEKAISQQHCDICDQDVDERHIALLVQRVQAEKNGFSGLSSDDLRLLQSLRERKASLKTMNLSGSKEKLELLEKQLSELNVSISDNERHLKTLKKDLEKYGDAGELSIRIQNSTREIVRCRARIQNIEEGITQENIKITQIKSTLQTLNTKLDTLAKGAEVSAARRRVELCEQIHAIFEEGITRYRDKLKTDVERDASELFRQISSDEDYVHLAINDNYGLSIVHKSGEVVPLRSAGFEHVVALSLIGALHKNAPLRGPIIMDSPFFRLDPVHKANITKTLPKMSEQIILLAYTQEIDEQEARAKLGTALKREYRLDRKTSFNTQIEARNI